MTKVYNPPPNWPSPPPGWAPPPGWRPDPAWGPPPNGWSFYVDRPAPLAREPWAAPEEPTRPPARRGRLLLLAGVVVVALTAVALMTGGKLGAFNIGADGLRVEFDNSTIAGEGVSEESLDQAQPELTSRIEALEQEAAAQGSATEVSVPDLTGTWVGDNGLLYGFQQYGTELVWWEESPDYGVTAVGLGQFDGVSVAIDYEVFDGSTGYVNLTYDGMSLSGFFSNGIPVSMSLSG